MIDFDHVLDAINDVTQKSEKYVIGNHFTEQSSLSLADWATFLSFKEDKTLQSDIENYISNYKPELDIPSKQFISSQRSYIKPLMFQDISKRYLELIDYKYDNQTFKTFKGFRLCAGDGSDFEIPDFSETRAEFNIKNTPKYRKPAMCKFSSIQDVLNGFILDGTVADYKAGELPLMHQHLKDVKNMIVPEKTIWTLDRGYPAMELYARIIEMNSYFIVRLRKDSYIEERMNIKQEDSPISLKITKDRLKKFHDPELKNIYSKKWTINLRIITITNKNGEKYSLLTNITKKVLGTKEIGEIYKLRWGIETNYNTMKNRIYIENYSGKRRICIEQDIYSKFLKFNIFHYLKIKFNKLIKNKKEQIGDYRKYQVDQANLIRNLKDKLLLILLSKSRKIQEKLMKNFHKSCMRYPNRVKKNKTTPRKKKVRRCYNIQYQPT